MALPPDRGQVIFRTKDIELISQLIEGTFPDYQRVSLEQALFIYRFSLFPLLVLAVFAFSRRKPNPQSLP